MKQSEIQVGQEYTISEGVLQDALYFARYSKLRKSYFTITAEVLETGIKREYSERNDGVRIALTGEAAEELASYFSEPRERENDFVISNRQVLESVEAIAAAERERVRKQEQKHREYQAEQAAKGAELDNAVLASIERRVHDDAGDELRRVRSTLTDAIERAQELLSYVADTEAPRGHDEDTWGEPLPTISAWHMGSLKDVTAAVATYNEKARVHNMFVEARIVGQEKINA